jgi:DNA-binding response OmpR family regulator
MAHRILVIEDDDQTALFIQHVLQRAGYAVDFATDGKAAVDLIAKGPVPDLITLDIDLPYATGDELMLKIKTTEGWDRVPVVMVTRKPKTVETTWAVRSGAKAYLVKPFKPAELLDTVRKLATKT